MNRVRAILAAAMIGLPIVCGAAVFQLTAPSSGAGVYVCAYECAAATTFRVPSVAMQNTSWMSDAAAIAAVIPVRAGAPVSFLLVSPAASDRPVDAGLYAFVVDRADPHARADLVAIPTAVRRLNAQVFQIDIDRDALGTVPGRQYRDVVARTPSSRSTLDLLLGLRVNDDSGHSRMHVLRLPSE